MGVVCMFSRYFNKEDLMTTPKTEFIYRGIPVSLLTESKPPGEIRQMVKAAKRDIDKVLDKPQEGPRVMFLSQAIEMTYRDKWSRIKDGRGTLNRMLVNLEIIGDRPIQLIDNQTVQRLRRALETSSCRDCFEVRSPTTVNRHMAHLKTVLNHCIKMGYLGYLPHIDITRERDCRRTRTIRPTERAGILKYMRTPTRRDSSSEQRRGLALQVEVLFETGMRIGESLKMTYKRHIMLQERTIQLTGDLTKSKLPRAIPMTDRVHEILTERQRRGYRERPFPWDKYFVTNVWNRAKASIGIDDTEFVPHAIRHTVATELLGAGWSIPKVQKLLGHQNASTTEIYNHMTCEDIREDLEQWSRKKNKV